MALKTQIKTLRAHKLAALLVDARLYARRTPEEACELLNWDEQHLENLEMALETPTLPELESLAAIYAVPVDHFFGNISLSDGMPRLRTETMRQRLELRDRILGAMMMQARLRRNFSRDDLSMATGLSLEQIVEYELGQVPIPVTDLEDITRMLQIDLMDWIDSYAIPSRDMVFKPYKLTEIHSVTAETTKESVPVEEEISKQIEEPVEKIPVAQAGDEAALKPEPAIKEKVEEPVAVAPQEEAVVEVKVAPVATVESEKPEPQPEPAPVSAGQEVQELSASEIEFLMSKELPKELVQFISNPINRQYLLLANNLSRMPADQLRRIAESLLEITF